MARLKSTSVLSFKSTKVPQSIHKVEKYTKHNSILQRMAKSTKGKIIFESTKCTNSTNKFEGLQTLRSWLSWEKKYEIYKSAHRILCHSKLDFIISCNYRIINLAKLIVMGATAISAFLSRSSRTIPFHSLFSKNSYFLGYSKSIFKMIPIYEINLKCFFSWARLNCPLTVDLRKLGLIHLCLMSLPLFDGQRHRKCCQAPGREWK